MVDPREESLGPISEAELLRTANRTLRVRIASLEAKVKVAEETLNWLNTNQLIKSTVRVKEKIVEALAKLREPT